jgi:hypothetical protein
MTPEQLQALKDHIDGDPAFNGIPNNTDGAYAISLVLNAPAAPDFIVWRTAVDPYEIMSNGMDWTRVDNLSVGKARIWDWMTRLGTLNPSKLNIRAGIDAAWVGTAQDLAVRAVVYTHCKRNALLGEKVLATGTGTTATPATMGYEGPIGYQDIDTARHLP